MSKGRLINIGGDANDASYRYKMPGLVTKVEGRGNGIKTVLMNIVDVCKHLHTEPNWVTKFFGIEVGALSKFNTKRDVGIVNGVHHSSELQKLLRKYITHFVLCPKCKLPELQQKIHSKKSLLIARCLSCGWKGPMKSNHRVKQYIINNPPVKAKVSHLAKDGRRRKKGKEKPKEKSKSQLETNNPELEDENVWSVDVSEEAVAKRKQEEMASLNKSKSMRMRQTEESKLDSGPAAVLRRYVSDMEHSDLELLDEIKRLAMAHTLEGVDRMKVIFNALLKTETVETLKNSFKTYKTLFQKLTKKSEEKKQFWAVIEELIAMRGVEKLLPKTYMILEALYDLEIMSDEEIIIWYNTPTDEAWIVEKNDAQEIRNRGKVFVEWLQQESESEESEVEEDEEE